MDNNENNLKDIPHFVLASLCYYDMRNPYHIELDEDEDEKTDYEKCYCDNCFYGKTKLANYIIEQKNENKER